MVSMEHFRWLLYACLCGMVSSERTLSDLTLYTAPLPRNQAKMVCEENGEVLVQMDKDLTYDFIQHLKTEKLWSPYRADYKSKTNIMEEIHFFWTGAILENSASGAHIWSQSCDPVFSNTSHFPANYTASPYDYCVAETMEHFGEWTNMDCSEELPFVCLKKSDKPCELMTHINTNFTSEFLKHNDTVDKLWLVGRLSSCQSVCLANSDCWAFTFTDKEMCNIYSSHNVTSLMDGQNRESVDLNVNLTLVICYKGFVNTSEIEYWQSSSSVIPEVECPVNLSTPVETTSAEDTRIETIATEATTKRKTTETTNSETTTSETTTSETTTTQTTTSEMDTSTLKAGSELDETTSRLTTETSTLTSHATTSTEIPTNTPSKSTADESTITETESSTTALGETDIDTTTPPTTIATVETTTLSTVTVPNPNPVSTVSSAPSAMDPTSENVHTVMVSSQTSTDRNDLVEGRLTTPAKDDNITPTVDNPCAGSPTVNDEECYCGCDFPLLNETERQEFIAALLHELTKDKSNFSASRRKYISVSDDRPSAQNVGIVGIVLLSVALGGIVLLDLSALARDFGSLIKNIRSLLGKNSSQST